MLLGAGLSVPWVHGASLKWITGPVSLISVSMKSLSVKLEQKLLTILILLWKKENTGNHLSDEYLPLWLLYPKTLVSNSALPCGYSSLALYKPHCIILLIPAYRGYPSCTQTPMNSSSCAISHSLMHFHRLAFSCLVYFYTYLSMPAQDAEPPSFWNRLQLYFSHLHRTSTWGNRYLL